MELNNNSAEQQFAKFEFIQKTSHSCTISSNFVRHLFLRLSSQAFLLRPLAPVPRAPCACINLKLQEPHPSPPQRATAQASDSLNMPIPRAKNGLQMSHLGVALGDQMLLPALGPWHRVQNYIMGLN